MIQKIHRLFPKIRGFLFVLPFVLFVNTLQAKSDTQSVQLYALNGGYLDIHDGAKFSDTEFYPHKPLHLVDPCFLIKHPKGWLLWDLGLGDQYVNKAFEDTKHGATLRVSVSIISQLKQLGLTPNDIQYVALSHTHFDHTGNANLFPKATWLIQDKEYQALQKKPLSSATDAHIVPILQVAPKVLLHGNYDVFGDGSVIILSTPGHTVGHQSLQIKLKNTGRVILSGDLYHTRRAYHYKQIPTFNASRADTMASMSRMDGILKNTEATLIIQHDKKDFAALPQFPEFLN